MWVTTAEGGFACETLAEQQQRCPRKQTVFIETGVEKHHIIFIIYNTRGDSSAEITALVLEACYWLKGDRG